MRLLIPVWVVLATGVAGCSESSPVDSSPFAPTSVAGTEAKPQPDSPVTTVVQDLDAQGQIADTFSDGLGAYTNGAVRSVLMSNVCNGLTYGDWQFDTYSSTRGVGHRFDEDDAVPATDSLHYVVPAAPPFAGAQVLKTRLQTNCTCIGKSMFRMDAGSQITCILINNFDFGGRTYTLNSTSNYPDTTDARITCLSGNQTTGCSEWYIDPTIPAGLNRGVARLYRKGTKPNQPATHLGNFYLGYRIHIIRP